MFYLASQSPRRRELLESVGLEFSVLAPDIDETGHESESARQTIERLARDKAEAGLNLVRERGWPLHPVLAADTRFRLDRKALGDGGALSKTEEAVVDLAAAGFTVRRMLDVIPEDDDDIRQAVAALLERGVLRADAETRGARRA